MTPIEVRRREDVSLAHPSAGTEGRVVYAVGDVHGRYDLLVALLQAIADDMASLGPGRRPLLVFLGDYIDRGPQAPEVLTTLIWLSRYAEFDVSFLRGNHEDMMLAFLDGPEKAAVWLRVGGAQTLRAYGIEVEEGESGPEACARLRDELLDQLPASHLAFLQSLEMCVTCGDYAFVHAGVRPGVSLRQQADADLLWIRKEFLEAQQPFERIIVHGHTWASDAPVLTASRIGVDTGAYKTGVLTAVRLGSSPVEVIQARGTDRLVAPATTESDVAAEAGG